jgi:hypothetical protein
LQTWIQNTGPQNKTGSRYLLLPPPQYPVGGASPVSAAAWLQTPHMAGVLSAAPAGWLTWPQGQFGCSASETGMPPCKTHVRDDAIRIESCLQNEKIVNHSFFRGKMLIKRC